MRFERIAFVASQHEQAQRSVEDLRRLYDGARPGEADVIVALGGDGFMLETLHRHLSLGVPIYGMNRGSVGFLMNDFGSERLRERLEAAIPERLHPLRMVALDVHGRRSEALAFNEVALLRETRQAAKIRIRVDGVVRLEEMICDGVLVSTAAGSTAYNYSAHGPIVPLGAGVLPLTPISAFRPRRWRGALLPHTAKVTFDILDAGKRPVSAVADFTEVRDVVEVDIAEDRTVAPVLLFDPEQKLSERVLKEQFMY
ncbi:MAG: NAD kinase [Proteobacteria bacterium]|nr:NAD kinase [Pseudomonadota bacterium]